MDAGVGRLETLESWGGDAGQFPWNEDKKMVVSGE